MKTPIAFLTLIVSLIGCSPLPVKLTQANLTDIKYEIVNDSLNFNFNNPLECPLRIIVKTANDNLQKKIDKNFPVVIKPQGDTFLTYHTNLTHDEIDIKLSALLGNPNDKILKKAINLPFKKGSKYQVIQGYNGSYSHSSDYSKYAIDFNLKEGDTVCASADGFVVGVIKDYSKGGKSKKWRDYANYITIFHPEMNLYTQYVHLTFNGSFVKVGDKVKAEQAIGLSGETGHTDMEHLHFNVLMPNLKGMESTQINFLEGYKGIDLKRGDIVTK